MNWFLSDGNLKKKNGPQKYGPRATGKLVAGRAYVVYFGPDWGPRAAWFDCNWKNGLEWLQTIDLIEQIQDAFGSMLDAANWLDEGTRLSAQDKLLNMNLRIGYPDYILDDDALDKDYQQVTPI